GQLGDNSTDSKLTPVQVLGVDAVGVLSGIIQITAGSSHACALKNDSSVFCWGNNWAGELGDNTTTKRYTPVQVLGVDAIGTLTDVGQIVSGGAFSCAIKNDGSVFCWGYNGAGELGDGSYIDRLTPVQVLGVDGIGTLTDVSQVTAGFDHACALKIDGSVNCWGYNPYGQLGDNTTVNKNVPVQVVDADGTGSLTDVNEITAGMDYVCALKNDGSVFCWGYNVHGQLGDNTTTQKLIPVQVLGVNAVGTLSDVNRIAAGSNHTCALKNDGSVFCWGYNGYGQLGDDTTVQKLTPIQVLGVGTFGTLSDVSQIATGASHTCALKNDGSVFCWGY
ncbi:MAG: RCC1 repeat-containing protein, partial [bacterium]|nr:RCC1 repeat-containing protein [bacterium]